MIFILILILKLAAILIPGYFGWSVYQDYKVLDAIKNTETAPMIFEFNDLSINDDLESVEIIMPKYLVSGETYPIQYVIEPGESEVGPRGFRIITVPDVASITDISVIISPGGAYSTTEQFALNDSSLNEAGSLDVLVKGVLELPEENLTSSNKYHLRVFSPSKISSMEDWLTIKAILAVILIILGLLFVIFVW